MKAPPIFVLTGAGVSAESGIATFRDAGGVWQQFDLMEVATPEGFARNPRLVQSFYNGRRAQLGTVAPNAAHAALARLQRDYPAEVFIVTQNVDDLHERAGATVVHMHGELGKARCVDCHAVWHWLDDIDDASRCADCGGGLRPHVVWFGEMPLRMDEIEAALCRCGLFAAIGTSGEVYPAAGFVRLAAHAGARTLEINLECGDAGRFDESLSGPATTTVPRWVEGLLAHASRPDSR